MIARVVIIAPGVQQFWYCLCWYVIGYLVAVSVCELVLVGQEPYRQYEHIPVLPWHLRVAQVARFKHVASRI